MLGIAIHGAVQAHGISGSDAAFVARNQGAQIIPFLYLGAKHMVTGYDHLLFILGVIFFLYRLSHVALYVTMFSIGHSITLLTGVLGGIHVNPYLIDAIIGLSVVYKAFDNLEGFQTLFGFQINQKAAVLVFGLLLVGELHPLLLAGFLYIGSGLGLAATLLIRRVGRADKPPIDWPPRHDWPALAAAIVLGGAIAPTLLMFGLQQTPASVTSLLLNLESVLTALLAWVVFREHVDRRIALGMMLIVAGGLALSWHPGQHESISLGSLLIPGACLCWAADNNFTRKVSNGDAVLLTCMKGLAAGVINLSLAWLLDLRFPALGSPMAGALITGFIGYGVSLTLFVLALRHLGAARTGAYFSLAPFVGVIIALLFQHEPLTVQLLVAAALMALGLWLHLTEHHEHDHTHQPLEHAHVHTHDAHHQHEHDFPWKSDVPHTHNHQHVVLTHRHPHFPDTHHQHGHSDHKH
jgi:drug/metabolite transporter (DMT)-like permease